MSITVEPPVGMVCVDQLFMPASRSVASHRRCRPGEPVDLALLGVTVTSLNFRAHVGAPRATAVALWTYTVAEVWSALQGLARANHQFVRRPGLP